MTNDGILFEGDTAYGHYIVANTVYSGRPARVLYSGKYRAAQSGWALDGKPELLFDYNQRFMELIDGLQPKRLLLIGGGAFTLPKALNEQYPDLQLDIVELDEGLLPIAKQYFDFAPTEHTRVFHADGASYLADYQGQPYDLILIDAYTDATIPSELQTPEVVAGLKRSLRPGGVVAMNIIAAYYGDRSAVLRRQISLLIQDFKTVEIFLASRFQSIWLPQNFVVTAHNSSQRLEEIMRYEKIALPTKSTSDPQ